MDDFSGKFCNNGTFPVVRAVRECFEMKPTTTTLTTKLETQPQTTKIETSSSTTTLNMNTTSTQKKASRLFSLKKVNKFSKNNSSNVKGSNKENIIKIFFVFYLGRYMNSL